MNTTTNDLCPRCDSTRSVWVNTDDTGDTWECHDCGHERITPIPSRAVDKAGN
jgi:Zn ribbon nucleic-acid-binding protein